MSEIIENKEKEAELSKEELEEQLDSSPAEDDGSVFAEMIKEAEEKAEKLYTKTQNQERFKNQFFTNFFHIKSFIFKYVCENIYIISLTLFFVKFLIFYNTF